VVKLERPGKGDSVRRGDGGGAAPISAINRNKKASPSTTSSPREGAPELAAGIDVLVENYRPTMPRAGRLRAAARDQSAADLCAARGSAMTARMPSAAAST
jgi:crotonobetainyl-CoA:carnitine CoA-transferase CaiB-like acyl-CoA transferase